MAPCTRAAAAVALAAKPCLLLELSHDELGVVAHELCDPLRPQLAVHLSSTAEGLRVPMQAALVQLRQQRQERREARRGEQRVDAEHAPRARDKGRTKGKK